MTDQTHRATASPIDPSTYRRVLSTYPTGVAVVTSIDSGVRLGLAVGSFTSISLDPPLVGFFPAKTSMSWRAIEATGRFCVNILGAHQLDICRRFAARSSDKFGDLAHGYSPAGLPLIDGAAAWIECRIDSVVEIGDHYLVVGAVDDMGRGEEGAPLIFFRNGYHDVTSIPA